MSVTLLEAIVQIDEALDEAKLPHAFGGALALAWCTGEPRATFDIDINIFVAPSEARRVLDAFPPGISHDTTNRARLERDGQERLWWDRIAVDVFLSNTSFHEIVADEVIQHPFGGRAVPFLSCQSLALFKAFFDRDKDWLDLRAMVQAASIESTRLQREIIEMLGTDDPRVEKLDLLVADADRATS